MMLKTYTVLLHFFFPTSHAATRTRRVAAEDDAVDLSATTHCRCGFTATFVRGQPCCVNAE